jgi:HSP20 family protein
MLLQEFPTTRLFDTLRQMHQLEQAFCEPGVEGRNSALRRTFVPRTDVYESANEIIVMADLPGADLKDVDITIEKNILAIKATVQNEVPDGHTLTYSEHAVGDYERKFSLPSEIDRENISATMKNGVLKLVLPKNATAQLRKIEVKPE